MLPHAKSVLLVRGCTCGLVVVIGTTVVVSRRECGVGEYGVGEYGETNDIRWEKPTTPYERVWSSRER